MTIPRIIPRLIPVAALIFGVACSTQPGEDAQTDQQAEETDDVTIVECTTDSVGMVARLAITNNSAKRSNYSVNVAFISPDGSVQHATGFAFVTGVEPDQQAASEAHSLTTAPGEFVCKIIDVDRTSDVG